MQLLIQEVLEGETAILHIQQIPQVLGHRHTLSRKDLESNVETERAVVFVSM